MLKDKPLSCKNSFDKNKNQNKSLKLHKEMQSKNSSHIISSIHISKIFLNSKKRNTEPEITQIHSPTLIKKVGKSNSEYNSPFSSKKNSFELRGEKKKSLGKIKKVF